MPITIKILEKIISSKFQIAFFTLLALLTGSSCDGVLTSETKQDKYELNGNFYETFLGDTTTIIPSEVYLDGAVILPDSTDRFFFKLSEGEHTIEIDMPNYEPFDSTFLVNTEVQSFNFELSPKMDDYFPTKVRNKWVYKGSSSSNEPGSYTTTSTEEKITWELIGDSISTETNTKVFLFTSTYQATSIRTTLVSIDTTITDTSSTFSLKTEKGMISFSGNTFLPSLNAAIRGLYGYSFYSGNKEELLLRSFKYYGLPKKFPTSRFSGEDILIIPDDVKNTGKLLIRKNLGIVRINEGHCCSNSNYHKKFVLESFEEGDLFE